MPCLRCGICCVRRQPELDEGDVEAIARGFDMELGLFKRAFLEEHPTRPDIYVFFHREPECPFLSYGGGLAACTIHEFKPAACRNWTPSLSRPECREGLARLGQADDLALPHSLYPRSEDIEAFCRSLERGGRQSVQEM